MISLPLFNPRSHRRKHSVHILAPIDSRKLLGLGEDCAEQFSCAVVRVEPASPAAFWDIARRAMADLAGAQTPEGARADQKLMTVKTNTNNF
jgi:hypothetical protein